MMEAYITILIIGAIIVGIWEAVWKAFALWACARNRQVAWFVLIFILNTAGILPIVYLVWFQKKRIFF